MVFDDKDQTLPQELIVPLFTAKFKDLSLPNTDEQLNKFMEHANKRNINGKVTFKDMNLGLNFANAFADIFYYNPTLRVTHVNLSGNLLGGKGALIVVKALVQSPVLIALNLSSNEIKPKGINEILNQFMYNQNV